MSKQEFPRAIHLPGGNVFDDMRINIAESHRALEGRNFKANNRG